VVPAPDRPAWVDFHFDVMCPWAYQTSHWIREVRTRTGLAVNWRFFSLEEINRVEGKRHPWERPWSYGWSMLRIGAVLRRRDMALLDAWYERAGSALHREGRKPHDPAVARQLLAEIGIDPGVVDEAIADPTTHDEVRADHTRVVLAGGYGVPSLFLPDGQLLFGPVLLDPPTGDAAVRLWDAVVAWTEFPHLYELQRPKSRGDERAIVAAFQPYLAGRDWVSINRGQVVPIGRERSEGEGTDG
jgi:2-hydroxychromene-2-carboxylate isomerase